MTNKAILYNGDGVYPSSVQAWRDVLSSRGFDVEVCNGADYIHALYAHPKALAVLPGGHSTGFRKNLGETGAAAIRHFVHMGGVFVGICGGLYYLTENIAFKKYNAQGQEELEQNKGIGLLLADSFNQEVYKSSKVNSSRDTSAKFVTLQTQQGLKHAFYNGGPRIRFTGEQFPMCFARFDDGYEAGFSVRAGNGMVIGLSVHPEYSMANLPNTLKPKVPNAHISCLRERMEMVEADHKLLLDKVFGIYEASHRRLAQELDLS